MTYDPEPPLDVIHVAVDAPVQFYSIMFIPQKNYNIFGLTKEEIGLEKSQLQLEINEITFNINDVTKTRAAQKEYSPIDKVSMAQEQTLMESIAIRSLSAFFPQEIPIIFKAGKA